MLSFEMIQQYNYSEYALGSRYEEQYRSSNLPNANWKENQFALAFTFIKMQIHWCPLCFYQMKITMFVYRK